MVTVMTRFFLRMTLTALVVAGCASTAHAQNFGEWHPPSSVDPLRVLGLNTSFNDGCPIESPDGDQLFFASDRAGDLDIWVAFREDEAAPWGSPVRLPYPVNVTGQHTGDPRDFCPTPLTANRLLYVSARANNCGGSVNNPDIYFTRLHPAKGWLPPQPLNCNVNSGYDEFSPSVVETEGKTLLYFSSNRGNGTHQKIYVSEQQADGDWGDALEVVELGYVGAQDARPNVRKDGLEIVFDSTRDGGMPEVWTASRASILEPWSNLHRLDVVNSAGADTRATISRDGTRLYVGTTRANVTGDRGADIFVSTRSGPGAK